MKVLHLWWMLSYGGIETMLVNISNAQAKEGAEVYVVIIDKITNRDLLNGFNSSVNVISLGRNSYMQSLESILKLDRVLKKVKPDVVHLHGSNLCRMIYSKEISHVECVTLHALPYGTVRHDGFMHKLLPILDMKIHGNVACIDRIPLVFSISNAVRNELQDKYGVGSVVVNNGIVTSKFITSEKTSQNKPFHIVQVSRLEHDKKGQDLLIEAVAKMEEIEVDFIGDGNSLNYLKHLAHKRGVEHRVHFLGSKTQDFIAMNLCNYNLFVQPSRFEGFGLTVAEAMAANIPVLVSSGQGPAEVTKGDMYGWTFDNGNIDNLVTKLNYIIRHYSEATLKAISARKYVIDNYDVAVTAKKYLKEYSKLLIHK